MFFFFFHQTVSLVLIIVGTIGNLLSILVMSRRNMRSSNAAVYLITLAIADTGALNLGLLPLFLFEVDGTRIMTFSGPICKTNLWVTRVTVAISAWILVAFTIERFLSVYFPHRLKVICTHRSSIIVVICIVLVIFAQHSHILYMFGVRTVIYNNMSVQINCTMVSDDYLIFFKYINPWIDLCLNCFLPTIIVVVCNICIATRVLLRRRNMQQITNNTASMHQSSSVTDRQDNQSRLTIMLFTVTMVFLITTAPVRVLFLFADWLRQQGDAFQLLVRPGIIMLKYVNNSINFFLYCLTGSKFRNELQNMFR
ncbi:unnamed protein product [Candidula unifasciata]|uniref:G-protein coupled receptors family 1 profile domain-containing protein n=1 Tax=Candidula unifasciata TaxID=100452 RepID=A0A8S3ZV35_9EUPU|nr:unnamed protein product [Candidula unifasciata]